MTPPPPPPPRPQRQATSLQSKDEVAVNQAKPLFLMEIDTADNIMFQFPLQNDPLGHLSLRTVVAQYLGIDYSGTASAERLFTILGRLRFLQYDLQKYNAGLASKNEDFAQYWRQHTLRVLSGFGFSSSARPEPLHIHGLDNLISQLEAAYGNDLKVVRDLISNGKITFKGLGELFRPGRYVKRPTISDAYAPSIYKVTNAYYEENRAIYGNQQQFHITLEVVIPLGCHFSVASFSEVFLPWNGAEIRDLSELAYEPVSAVEEPLLLARAQRAVTYGGMGPSYMAYAPDTFFVHHGRTDDSKSGMTRARNASKSLTGGRIMLDQTRGTSLGHCPCQGADEATQAIVQLIGRYRQWLSNRLGTNSLEEDSTILWENVPGDLLICCWPVLVGFSFTAKAWGHVLVDGLSNIQFQDDAFSQLVLSEERKRVLRAVMRSGVGQKSHDLVSSEQGGLVFLLHGPPGVGKTLTVEAVAEVLHRPLYHITMGELGVTPHELESRLGEVLGLCADWNALAVLDGAEVFLEARSNPDLIRNAMVCVTLRVLEHHPGILFLVSNRVRALDPAFESRITLAIVYEALDIEARAQIWKAQLAHGGEMSSNIDYNLLGGKELNGRQIKNVARLARAIAHDEGTPLSQEILLSVIEVASHGLCDSSDDTTWEDTMSQVENAAV